MAHVTGLSSEVAPNIFAIPVPIPYPFKYVNCYLLKPGPGVSGGPVLVDCALETSEAKRVLEAALHEHGLGLSDLEHLVVTHHHPDHYGLAGLIEVQGPTVWMLDVELERGHIFWTQPEQMTKISLRLFQQHGIGEKYLAGLEEEMAATRKRVHPALRPKTFTEGQRLALAGMHFQVVWTPGHADGHAMLLRESDGVLLAGDNILEHISPNIGLWAYSYPNPLQHYFESLKTTAALGASVALPGHYHPIKDVAGRVAELEAHHLERLEALLQLLNHQPQTCWQLSLGLFPGNLSLTQRRFAWSETLAHLEYLVALGRARRFEQDGVIHYSR